MSGNRIFPDELALSFWASELQWRRLLYSCDGTYIELDLTPRNFPKASPRDWERIAQGQVRIHTKAKGPGDLTYRWIVKNIPTRDIVVALMTKGGLTKENIEKMLSYDYMPEIDWKELRIWHVAQLSVVTKKGLSANADAQVSKNNGGSV